MIEKLTFALSIIAGLSAVITAIYAFITYRILQANQQAVATMRAQTEATLSAAEADIVRAFLDDYFQPSMADALRRLRAWQEHNGANFASTWLTRLRAEDEHAREVDQARRTVKGYFEKATCILSAGLIRPKAFQAITYVAGLNLYYDVVDPLELELNAQRLSRTVELLKQHCGRFKEGEQIKPVPPSKQHSRVA